MTEDRRSALDAIGFVWEVTRNDNWMNFFKELKQYKAKEGHYNVPRNYSENKQLGTWVRNQRTQNRLFQEGKQSRMTEDRKKCTGIYWICLEGNK